MSALDERLNRLQARSAEQADLLNTALVSQQEPGYTLLALFLGPMQPYKVKLWALAGGGVQAAAGRGAHGRVLCQFLPAQRRRHRAAVRG